MEVGRNAKQKMSVHVLMRNSAASKERCTPNQLFSQTKGTMKKCIYCEELDGEDNHSTFRPWLCHIPFDSICHPWSLAVVSKLG